MERIYGIREGNSNKKGINQYVGEPNNSVDQSDIATQLGISVDTLQNYKMLAEMIPEFEELVDTGIAKIIVQSRKNKRVFEIPLTEHMFWSYSIHVNKKESPFTGCRP